MEDREQDEQPEDTAEPVEAVEPAESAPPVPSTGITPSQLYRLRREVAEARRVIDAADKPDPDRIEEYAKAAEEARETLRGTSIAEQYLRLNPHHQSLMSEEMLGSTRYAQQIAGQLARNYGAGSALQSTVTALESAGKFPDSGVRQMLSQIGEISDQIARMNAPAIGSVSAAVQSLADVYAKNPALLDLGKTSAIAANAMSGNPALTSGVSGIVRMIAESGLYTRSLIEQEGTVSALQKMINETSAGQRLADLYAQQYPDPNLGTVGALQQMINQASGGNRLAELYAQAVGEDATVEDLDDDLARLSEDLNADDIAGLTQYALEDAGFETRALFYQRLEEAAPEDLDAFERLAKEALEEEGVEEDLDAAVPYLAPREALLALFLAQRPDISDDPQLHRRIRRYVGGSGIFFYAYLRIFNPGFFVFLGTLLEVLGLTALLMTATDRTVARGKKPEDDQDD